MAPKKCRDNPRASFSKTKSFRNEVFVSEVRAGFVWHAELMGLQINSYFYSN